LKRSITYLASGDWPDGAADFRRAENGAPGLSKIIDNERWSEVAKGANGRVYLDLKTFDDNHRHPANFWLKQIQGSSDEPAPFSLEQYQVDCASRQIRALTVAEYDQSGKLVATREGGRWVRVIPGTIGETMLSGVCRGHRRR
jgi:hypothetical protein